MKSKTKQETKNQVAWSAPPTTEAQQHYDDLAEHSYNTADPTIGYAAGKAEQNLKNRYSNPWGAQVSPEVMAAQQYEGLQEINAARGVALQADASNRKAAKLQAVGYSAAAHAPQMYNSQTNMTGSQTQPIGPALIGAAGAAAGGWLS